MGDQVEVQLLQFPMHMRALMRTKEALSYLFVPTDRLVMLGRETKPVQSIVLDLFGSIDIRKRDHFAVPTTALTDGDCRGHLIWLMGMGNLNETSQYIRLPGFEQWVLEFFDVSLEEEDLALEAVCIGLELYEPTSKVFVGCA